MRIELYSYLEGCVSMMDTSEYQRAIDVRKYAPVPYSFRIGGNRKLLNNRPARIEKKKH